MKISIIMPVVDTPVGSGKPHFFLRNSIQSVLDAGHEDFELLIGCDGSIHAIRAVVESFPDPRIIYHEFPFKGLFGNPQRNALRKLATGGAIMYMDHDDCYVKGGLATVARHFDLWWPRPMVFQVRNVQNSICWEIPHDIRQTKIGGQMMVVPNDHLFPDWSPENAYNADYLFCTEVVRRYVRDGRTPVWVKGIIANLRPWSRAQIDDFIIDYGKSDLPTSRLSSLTDALRAQPIG